MCIVESSRLRSLYGTASRNHNRIVFEEMTSWTSLKWHIWMKTAFKTKHIKTKYDCIFIMMNFNIHKIIQKCILTSE